MGVNAIYAQRFAADGSMPWGSHPILVSSAATTPQAPSSYLSSFRVIPTADHNIAIFWAATPFGIYGEKLAVDRGSRLWGPLSGGVEVSAASTPNWLDATFASDDSAYVAYQLGGNIFLKHVEADGTLGTSDAGASTIDGGLDGGLADAGEIDRGLDAGSMPDSGMADAGLMDAGNAPDAGQRPATGSPDAGSPAADGGIVTAASGCGCSSNGDGSPWSVLTIGLMCTLAMRARTRRRKTD